MVQMKGKQGKGEKVSLKETGLLHRKHVHHPFPIQINYKINSDTSTNVLLSHLLDSTTPFGFNFSNSCTRTFAVRHHHHQQPVHPKHRGTISAEIVALVYFFSDFQQPYSPIATAIIRNMVSWLFICNVSSQV